ncbi:hypothetical protein UlMin_040823 [Ulmus minor]
MANPEPLNFRKYGVPFYAVDWVPYKSIRFDQAGKSGPESDQSLPQDEAAANRNYVVLAGGGGEGNSGIPNAVVVSEFDFASYSLSDQPVLRHRTDSDLPYRMAVHPGGEGLVCAFPESCRLFKWNGENGSEGHRLGLQPSERVLTALEDVGQQLALAFNNDGSLLASGGEDGNLRVIKWPSLETILNEAKVHSRVKDLQFSPDGKLLISLGDVSCKVWDVISSTSVASLPIQKDEQFCACRFSQVGDRNLVLYTATLTDKGGSIGTWDATTWKRIGSKHITRDAITGFDASADGKLLACGTTSGDVLIVNSTSIRIQQVIKKAHLGFVTAMRFSSDASALASASLDSSVRVTMIEEKKNGGFNLWLIILIILIAIATYVWQNPEKFASFATSK